MLAAENSFVGYTGSFMIEAFNRMRIALVGRRRPRERRIAADMRGDNRRQFRFTQDSGAKCVKMVHRIVCGCFFQIIFSTTHVTRDSLYRIFEHILEIVK